jgi:Transposase.
VGKSTHCSDEERRLIQNLRDEGKSIGNIAKLINRSKCMVHQALQPVRPSDNRGRPRKTTAAFDRLLVRKSKADPFAGSVALKKVTNAPISARTIRQRLQDADLHGRSPRKVPLLSKKNIKDRLKFAEEHLNVLGEERKSNGKISFGVMNLSSLYSDLMEKRT